MKANLIKIISCITALAMGIASYNMSNVPADNIITAANVRPVFVFDLNGVFFDTNKISVFRQLGIKDVLWYLIHYRSTQRLKLKFYTTLNRIQNTRSSSCSIKDPEGNEMPSLMVDWLRGTKPNKVILEQTLYAIAANPHWFSSATEQRLMAAMAHAIFDPKQFAVSRTFLPDLLPIVHALKKRGAQLYILSNWDRESFAFIKEKYKDFFDLFDGHFISGQTGQVKPEQDSFVQVMQQLSNRSICLFDDQQDNLDACTVRGWYPVLVSKKSALFGSNININAIKQHVLKFLKMHPIRSTLLKEQQDGT
jgi:HAD superfamily hydrolase (TIGR01549 family)